MQNELFSQEGRLNHYSRIEAELVVVGGGLAGVCCAISAARAGVTVCLIQDRPVLGGNASSEVRLWTLGATSHMGNNNRWSREGGIIDEILLENLYRNKEGNTLILDTILYEKVIAETNITLLLNTAVYGSNKSSATRIESVSAFCSQSSTQYKIYGKWFCDASGDGILAFQSGASFRMGAESTREFDEKLALHEENQELLGHSIYFYSKDAGKPVTFVPPAFASIDKMSLDRLKRIKRDDVGPRLWWLEYGGNLNTIEESEQIKHELWKVVYGIWDYIKNSGKFENVENLTLEWVGTIPGKRESRRFNGHYMLTQQDVVEQATFWDAVSYGGWSIDHHPGDGIYSDKPPCRQYHSKGVYQIPLRCFVSKDIDNLFFAGRIISASHIAFGSTRVMATCAHGGHAVGSAVAMCLEKQLSSNQLLEPENVSELQQRLNRLGHFIPGVETRQSANLASSASISVSSEFELDQLPASSNWRALDISAAQLLPLQAGEKYTFTVPIRVHRATSLTCEVRVSSKSQNYTPDVTLETQTFLLEPGEQTVTISMAEPLTTSQYGFVCLLNNPDVDVALSSIRLSGVVSVFNGENRAVSNTGRQVVPDDLGVDEFEFWIPERRPGGENLALLVQPAIRDFSAANLTSAYTRPYLTSNAWVAELSDTAPSVCLTWSQPQTVQRICLHFDTDFDHALESSLWGHHESRIPFCVQHWQIFDEADRLIWECENQYLSIQHIELSEPCHTRQLRIQLRQSSSDIPVSLFGVEVG